MTNLFKLPTFSDDGNLRVVVETPRGSQAKPTEWGPVIGGLFLAFPAIFPASATLVEKHERERKENAGLRGAKRRRDAAAL